MAAIDISPVTAEITAQLPALAAVGAAVLLVLVVIQAFKWVRLALGGEEYDSAEGGWSSTGYYFDGNEAYGGQHNDDGTVTVHHSGGSDTVSRDEYDRRLTH